MAVYIINLSTYLAVATKQSDNTSLPKEILSMALGYTKDKLVKI